MLIAAVGLSLGACNRDRDTQPKPPLDPDDRVTDQTPDRSGIDEVGGPGEVPTDRDREPGDNDRDRNQGDREDLDAALGSAATAKAEFKAAGDNGPSGTVYFIEHGDAVRVVAVVDKLPVGKHAIHIHEKGDCSADDFSSAGEHFNPTGAAHDAPYAVTKHLGDMGNLTTNERGTAIFGMEIVGVALDGEAGEAGKPAHPSLAGKAVIIHQGIDDLRTQPGGDAGARIACAVIPSQ